jgi:hypothetical protein
MRRPSPFFFLALSLIFSLLIIFSVPLLKTIKPFLPFTNYLLGVDKPTSYLILLGNDAEMRANGGFAGSYAKLIVSYPRFDLSFQDIYVPNGQLKGYVTPPAPIQEAFQHGTWQLSNADWEPDFPTAASSIRWFMEKGNEINPDNLVLLNLTTIKKVLDVVGTFTVADYQARITPENLYLFLQGKAEMNFFPGSTQKKDALTAVGLSLKNTILRLPLNKKIQIAQILYQDLKDQNILINSTNKSFQDLLLQDNFAGALTSSTPDTYLLVEANLGANKANAYVSRETKHVISFSGNQTTHQVTLKLTNASPESNPNPPFHYGGNYIAYLRFYLPANAQNISVTASPSATQKYGLTEIGFWQTTPAQNQSTIDLSYTLPISKETYSLTILKQHGLTTSPQTIRLNGQAFQTSLENDYFLP